MKLMELVSACPTVSNRIREIVIKRKQKVKKKKNRLTTQRRDFRMFRFSEKPMKTEKMTYSALLHIFKLNANLCTFLLYCWVNGCAASVASHQISLRPILNEGMKNELKLLNAFASCGLNYIYIMTTIICDIIRWPSSIATHSMLLWILISAYRYSTFGWIVIPDDDADGIPLSLLLRNCIMHVTECDPQWTTICNTLACLRRR